MALAEFLTQLDELAEAAQGAFDSAADSDSLEAARVEYLGAKNGRLKAVQKNMGSVEPSERPQAGKRLNEVKKQIEAALAAAQQRLGGGGSRSSARQAQPFDATLPGQTLRWGHLHPITQTIEELKEIMGRLGFSVADGPEIEDERHNFEALNIPLEHPARDPLDNFYLPVAGVRRWSVVAAQPDQHGADSGDGEHAAAGSRHFAGTRLSARHTRRHALPHVPSDGRTAGRHRRSPWRI